MNNNRTETAKMLIQFFNLKFNSVRWMTEKNQNIVLEALDRAGGDAQLLKEHIKYYATLPRPQSQSGQDKLFTKCFEDFAPLPKSESQEEVKEVQVQPAVQPTQDKVASSLGILEQALIEVIKKQSVPQIEADIKSECKQMLADFIKEEYGSIERKITTVVDGKKVEVKGVQHEKFETVLKFVANNEPVFLTGPAGSGKNFLCKQVADALGLKFYFTNAVTQEYKLTGFTDANGKYQETQFYKAFTQGGVFMLDEMDASIPEVLVILNAAIANKYFDFPAPIGYVEAHPDFRVIAAGNTTGHGADYEYVGRNQLDGASLDRFAVVPIDYSETIENNMAGGDIELADFCRNFRKASEIAGIQIIVSYRAISRLAKMIQLLDITEALDTCLVKGLEKDDLKMITDRLDNSKYKEALKGMAA